ncbi:hypothetical protein [Pseudomonas nitroreducens]|uniref:hypothetical protein n=1 Tax=Pseudomonas nitroreducens TaxID=46680 RepID=UPI00351D99F2
MTTKNGAFAPMAQLGPKNVHSPDEILSISLKEIGVARGLDDLVLAAYVASGRMDALLLSGLIGRKEYRQNCTEIAHATEAVRLILEADDDQSH